MKKILIIGALLFGMNMYAQNAPVIDSIIIRHPETKIKVKTIKKPVDMIKTLDSLNQIYKTDEFLLDKYYKNAPAMRCKVRQKPVIKKPEKLILI